MQSWLFQRELPSWPNKSREEEYQADLRKATTLSLPQKPTVKVNEDKRMKLIKKIMNIEPKFDHIEYFKSTIYDEQKNNILQEMNLIKYN